MKTILSTIFFIFIATTAQAQDAEKNSQIVTSPKVIFNSLNTSNARLYRNKNSRIKKELSFKTKARLV